MASPTARSPLVIAVQTVAQALERADLRGTQGVRFGWGQAERADPLGGIAGGEHPWRLRAHPRREGRERGQVVVDGRRGQPLTGERGLPGHDIAAQTRREALVAVRLREKCRETGEVQGDLVGHAVRAHTSDREGQIAVDPGGQAIRCRAPRGVADCRHLPCSEIFAIHTVNGAHVTASWSGPLPGRALLSSVPYTITGTLRMAKAGHTYTTAIFRPFPPNSLKRGVTLQHIPHLGY